MSTILCTGGTGTLGRAFIEHLREKVVGYPDPNASTYLGTTLIQSGYTVRVYSRDDTKQAEMADEYPRAEWLRFLIGDVRDLDRLRMAMRGVDMVVHAAAIKHVGACERNPAEALETNARGTANVVQAAVEAGVKRLVLVSTDKAADPTTTLGASKLMAERIIVDSAKWTSTAMCVARLGNVWYSRGSFPQRAWKMAQAGKPIQVTDPKAVRYVITPERAGEFVHDVLMHGTSGRIYVPRMSRITVNAMMEAAGIRPEHPREIIGLQPGEKFEELILSTHEVGVEVEEIRQAYRVEGKA